MPRAELCRTIIAVNKVAIVEKTPEKVFDQMCAVLKKVVPYDRAGLTVYDHVHDALKIAAFHLMSRARKATAIRSARCDALLESHLETSSA